LTQLSDIRIHFKMYRATMAKSLVTLLSGWGCRFDHAVGVWALLQIRE